MLSDNIIIKTDGYKYGHFSQYSKGMSYAFSHIAARGSTIPGVNEIVHLGPQVVIKDHFMKPITRYDIDEAEHHIVAVRKMPFNRKGWEHILKEHSGYMPLRMRSAPEGTPIPYGNSVFTVSNVDPECAWLTSYFEPLFMSATWSMSTVATISREIKRMRAAAKKLTSDNSFDDYGLHDFGFRGCAYGGARYLAQGHLLNFNGTDTDDGIIGAMEYYNADPTGWSTIRAAEHSTITCEGRSKEFDRYWHIARTSCEEGGPGTIFAMVTDSYDHFAAVEFICREILPYVEKMGCVCVIRPDSGDPLTMPIETIKAISHHTKSGKINSKGYLVLPNHIRVIQGDGITINTIPVIIKNLTDAGWSIDNLSFGMGGGLLQQINRDTFKFAMKLSEVTIDGEDIEVFKDPVTDPGKKSLAGKVELYRDQAGNYQSIRKCPAAMIHQKKLIPQMGTVFFSHRGDIQTKFTNFNEMRERAKLVTP